MSKMGFVPVSPRSACYTTLYGSDQLGRNHGLESANRERRKPDDVYVHETPPMHSFVMANQVPICVIDGDVYKDSTDIVDKLHDLVESDGRRAAKR